MVVFVWMTNFSPINIYAEQPSKSVDKFKTLLRIAMAVVMSTYVAFSASIYARMGGLLKQLPEKNISMLWVFLGWKGLLVHFLIVLHVIVTTLMKLKPTAEILIAWTGRGTSASQTWHGIFVFILLFLLFVLSTIFVKVDFSLYQLIDVVTAFGGLPLNFIFPFWLRMSLVSKQGNKFKVFGFGFLLVLSIVLYVVVVYFFITSYGC